MFSETEIQQRLRKKLESLLEPIKIIKTTQQKNKQKDFTPDLIVKTKYKNKEKNLIIEIKSIGEPRHIERAITQLKIYSNNCENCYPIVASSSLSEKSRVICKQFDIGYIDLLGNVYIDLPYLHIEKESKETKPKEKKRQKKLFSPVATRIIRTLLLEPSNEWTIKSLSEKTHVSLGYTHRVVEKLLDELFLSRNKNYRLILKDKSHLLDVWRDSYSFENNNIHSFYTFEKNKDILFEKIEEISKSNKLQYALTLHSGASIIAPYVRYTDIHVYVESNIEQWIKQLDLRPVDSGANIYLIIPYDEGVFQGLQTINKKRIASNIQLYLDLYNYPKRGKEQADFLRERKIKF